MATQGNPYEEGDLPRAGRLALSVARMAGIMKEVWHFHYTRSFQS